MRTTSRYTYDNGLGCGGSSNCNCQSGNGLGNATDQVDSEAKQTKQDVIKTAKEYINDEIPFKYKAGAIAVGIGYCWWRSRARRGR